MPESKIKTGKNNKRIPLKSCIEPCPIERGMRIIGGKWTGSILWHLKDEPMRFNDISRVLGGASKKMISQRLKEMEANKLVKRKVLNTQPVAVSYELTQFGKTALSFLDSMKDWVIANEI
jgi:DNA-binding HxlR family transcriptional regulator